jgi:hypothetical protein
MKRYFKGSLCKGSGGEHYGQQLASTKGGADIDMATKKAASRGKGKVKKTMHEFKEGSLKSGSGKKVTSRKQAVAIGLSEARKAGAKIPTAKAKKKS